jgi:DNA-binding LytR/AlgR family response regulator
MGVNAQAACTDSPVQEEPLMPTAIVCDDEPLMREALKEQLQLLWPELEVVDEADNGVAAVSRIASRRPDVAFLDIQMPGMNGLQVAQLIEPPTQLVFVTAYDQHALAAFDTHAVDYLLKPLEPVRVARMVKRLRSQLVSPSDAQTHELVTRSASAALPPAPALEWLQVAVGQQIRMLHLDDVHYFESDCKYTRVVGEDCDGLIRLSLKELLASVDAHVFLQVHRSTVVNRRMVRAVHRKGEHMELEMRGRAERLKVSEANQHLFKAM